MNTKYINNVLIYSHNFRNNQNYIIGELDKKFLIHNFFEKKESYLLRFILSVLFTTLGLIYIIYENLLNEGLINPLTFNLNFIGEVYILYIIIFILGIFSLFIGLYMSMYLINYSYIIKFNKRIKIFFKKNTKGILLKKKPKGKYDEIYTYVYTDRYESFGSLKMKKEINNDFIYIKNNKLCEK